MSRDTKRRTGLAAIFITAFAAVAGAVPGCSKIIRSGEEVLAKKLAARAAEEMIVNKAAARATEEALAARTATQTTDKIVIRETETALPRRSIPESFDFTPLKPPAKPIWSAPKPATSLLMSAERVATMRSVAILLSSRISRLREKAPPAKYLELKFQLANHQKQLNNLDSRSSEYELDQAYLDEQRIESACAKLEAEYG